MSDNLSIFEKWLKFQLEKCKTKKGYSYKIIIFQKNKGYISKIIKLKHSRVRKELRDKNDIYYTIDKVYWITINIIQRMKYFYGLHSMKIKIKIEKVK